LPVTRLLRSTITILVLASVAGLLGCASSHDAPPASDDSAVLQTVKSFNGSKMDPRNSPQWFAQGALPAQAELQKLAKFDCQTVGKPTIKGDTATIKMRVLVPNTDNEVGQVEWTLVREGGNWKMKSVPLP
jgi:hypothetical protein